MTVALAGAAAFLWSTWCRQRNAPLKQMQCVLYMLNLRASSALRMRLRPGKLRRFASS
jgi:hypothetical protein